VYCFENGEPIDLTTPDKIKAVTCGTSYKLPYYGGHHRYTYVVTALDRVGNESKAVKKKVKL
jgi:hypothetical protein